MSPSSCLRPPFFGGRVLEGPARFEKRRRKRGAGRLFFWLLFFGRAKKSNEKFIKISKYYIKSDFILDQTGRSGGKWQGCNRYPLPDGQPSLHWPRHQTRKTKHYLNFSITRLNPGIAPVIVSSSTQNAILKWPGPPNPLPGTTRISSFCSS